MKYYILSSEVTSRLWGVMSVRRKSGVDLVLLLFQTYVTDSQKGWKYSNNKSLLTNDNEYRDSSMYSLLVVTGISDAPTNDTWEEVPLRQASKSFAIFFEQQF